jgi:hypothetical protein
VLRADAVRRACDCALRRVEAEREVLRARVEVRGRAARLRLPAVLRPRAVVELLDRVVRPVLSVERLRAFEPRVRAEVLLLRVAAERERLRADVPRAELRRVRDVPVLRDAVPRDRDDVVRCVPVLRDVPACVLRLRVPPARDPLRDDVLLRDEVPRCGAPPERERALTLRERAPAVLRLRVERVRVPELLRVEVPARPLTRRLRLPVVAFCRPTSLLKLLCWPPAVSSCTSRASLFSSNFSNQSSQSMASSESAPL